MRNISTSAFLFVGGNNTFQNSTATPAVPFAIDLGTLPATFVADGVGVSIGPGENFIGSLASVLVCDPKPHISGGRALLSVDGSLRAIASGKPTIGNILPSAANIFFTNGLARAVEELEVLETTNIINTMASRMFMSTNFSVDWDAASGVAPLDIGSVNTNMDTYTLSASKAFTDGYRKNGSTSTATFSQLTVLATEKEQHLALTTSKSLLYVAIAVFSIDLALLYVLCRCALTQRRYPFDLHSVVIVLREDAGMWSTSMV